MEFIHTPLPADEHHIRLIKFAPTPPDRPLNFSLVECKFSEKPAYNSLSYEWGNTAADKRILINDRPFFIRDNLHSFLNVLAESDYKNAFFFADAICINQNDVPERNTQVQRMGDLYAQAEKVLIWLGAATAESDFILDMCAEAECNELEKDDESQKKSTIESIDFNRSDGEALDTIYQRSYWTRLWIIQELFLAQDAIVFCGSKSTTWSTFRRLPRWNTANFVEGGFTGVDMTLASTPAGRHARDVLNELEQRKTKPEEAKNDLVTLVREFGRAQCFDIRDRVYGLLGFANPYGGDGRGLEVIADYSATPATLFVRLLSNMPRKPYLSIALDLFNILKLHHAQDSEILASIPPEISSLTFEVEFTKIGHLRHLTKPTPDVCRECPSPDENPPFKLEDALLAELGEKTIFEITTGHPQRSMAAHGGGPLYDMIPHDSCVTEGSAGDGDDVFLLTGTDIVLIRQQRTSESSPSATTTRYMRGILSATNSQESISRAGSLVDACFPHLNNLENASLRSEEHQIWSLMSPFEFLCEEFTLQQIVQILIYTGRHNDYWNEPL